MKRLPVAVLVVGCLMASGMLGPARPAAQAAGGGTTYYVAPDGRDQNNGTIGAPFGTIRAAVARLRPGDTLYIRAGVYTRAEDTIDSQSGRVPSGTSWQNPITIAAYPGESVTLRPPHNVAGIRLTTGSPSFLIFQGFTIDMVYSGRGADADGIFVYTAHHNRFEAMEVMRSQNFGVHFGNDTAFNEVLRSNIHHNGYAGSPITNGHALYITGSDNLFEGNDVYENQGYGFHIYNNTGPRLDPSRNIIRNNRIHKNGLHGPPAYGIVVAWGDGNVIEGNEIFENPGGIQVYTNSTNAEVRNNIVTNNKPLEGIVVQYAKNTIVRNNTVKSNGTAILDLGETSTFSGNSAPATRGAQAK